MLPKEWSRRPLGEIAQITSGGTPDRSEPTYWGGHIPWVTTGEIQFNTITDTTEKITDLGLKNSSAKLFPPGTLLMAMYGQGKTRGQVAKLGVEAATNQACAAILLKESQDADFHFHYLSSQYEAIRRLGNEGTQQNLSGGILKEVTVPVPPYAEQTRIARLLATWDKAIAVLECLLIKSREQSQSFKRSLLHGQKRLPKHRSKWKRINLDAVFERVARKNTIGNNNVLTISGQRGLISQKDFFNKRVASENLSGYTLIHRGEFAYNKSYSDGYPMGAIKPLEKYESGVVSSLYICFRIRDDVDAEYDFFRHYFEAGLLNREISSVAQEGARNHGLLNIGVSEFMGLGLHVPNQQEQKDIAVVLNAAECEVKNFEAQLSRLQVEKHALMQQLFTGKRRFKTHFATKLVAPA